MNLPPTCNVGAIVGTKSSWSRSRRKIKTALLVATRSTMVNQPNLYLSKENQENVCEMLAIVLWLGNVTFSLVDDENHVVDEALQIVAKLLGCRIEQLQLALSSREMQVRGEKFIKKLTLSQWNKSTSHFLHGNTCQGDKLVFLTSMDSSHLVLITFAEELSDSWNEDPYMLSIKAFDHPFVFPGPNVKKQNGEANGSPISAVTSPDFVNGVVPWSCKGRFY
ncbi:unnamed protein product [Lactuca saligna]|uniref:Uncharacterized protein n=1 Tax=Lactuca saligna TaxID=75948 RepID=A0AA35ZYM5_LACSI|nr:unnamed protein product [Lactuca saligna]